MRCLAALLFSLSTVACVTPERPARDPIPSGVTRRPAGDFYQDARPFRVAYSSTPPLRKAPRYVLVVPPIDARRGPQQLGELHERLVENLERSGATVTTEDRGSGDRRTLNLEIARFAWQRRQQGDTPVDVVDLRYRWVWKTPAGMVVAENEREQRLTLPASEADADLDAAATHIASEVLRNLR